MIHESCKYVYGHLGEECYEEIYCQFNMLDYIDVSVDWMNISCIFVDQKHSLVVIMGGKYLRDSQESGKILVGV